MDIDGYSEKVIYQTITNSEYGENDENAYS